MNATAATFFVNAANLNPIAPYQAWSTAATNIQDAIDAATNDDLVLVTDGTYKFGGRIGYGGLTNRVAVNKSLKLQSVNGPSKTIIQGNSVIGTNAVRCVYLTNNAFLSGFTLTNGATGQAGDPFQVCSGGGVWCEDASATISNCFITANAAYYYGGGSYSGTLTGCRLTNNTAKGVSVSGGGGAMGGMLTNCTLVKNGSYYGGGACSNILFNCVVYTNQGTSGGGTYACNLYGCYLTNNTASTGGGAYAGVLSNCTLFANVATSSGGGSASANVTNCLFQYNAARTYGGGAYQGNLDSCMLLGNQAGNGGGVGMATLNNCTLTSTNAANGYGGDAYESTLSNCLISWGKASSGGCGCYKCVVSCSAIFNNNLSGFNGSAGSINGGGSYQDTLYNCLLSGNYGNNGAAAYQSALVNCTVSGNGGFEAPHSPSATYGCTITNSIIYNNNANYNDFGSVMDHSCTIYNLGTTLGSKCFTNNPLFLSGSFRLQSNSPCIDAGNNAFVTGNVDYDYRARIVGAAVDIGAIEYQGTNLETFMTWLSQYNLPINGTADYGDADGDGMNNWQEWVAGTNPTNAASVLKLNLPVLVGTNLIITWQSVTNRTYYIQHGTNFRTSTGFTAIQSNLIGQPNTTTFTVTNKTKSALGFYRIGVQ